MTYTPPTDNLPTMVQWRSFRQQADARDQAARDVRPLMSAAADILESETRLSGHANVREVAVSAFSWQIKVADPTYADQAEDARRRVRSVIDQVLENHQMIPLLGVMCIEITWTQHETDGWVATPVRRLLPTELEQESPQILNILADEPGVRRIMRIDTAAPPETHIVGLANRLKRGGILRMCVEGCIMMIDMMREWANYSKKLKGVIQVLYEDGASDEEITAAKQAAESAIVHNFLVSSRRIGFNVSEIVKGSADSFERLVDKIQSNQAIAILGQANTSELPAGGGSRAALQVLNMIRADIHYKDIGRVEQIINNQLLLHDYRRNISKTGTPPWRFEINVPEVEDRSARIESVVRLLESGVQLVTDEVYNDIGFTRPPDVDDVMKITPPTPQF